MDWQLVAIIAGVLAIGFLLGRKSGGGSGDHVRPPRPAARPPQPFSGAGGPHAVRLEDIGPNKIAVIKTLRGFTQLGLAEAKDLAESAPAEMACGLSRADAENLLAALTEAGATARIV